MCTGIYFILVVRFHSTYGPTGLAPNRRGLDSSQEPQVRLSIIFRFLFRVLRSPVEWMTLLMCLLYAHGCKGACPP